MSDIVVIDGSGVGLSPRSVDNIYDDLLPARCSGRAPPLRQAEHAAFARDGNTIFSLEDDGELVVMEGHSRTAVGADHALRSGGQRSTWLGRRTGQSLARERRILADAVDVWIGE